MCRKSGSVYGSKHLQRRPTVYFCCCCDAVNAEGLWKQTQTRKIPTLRARVLGVFSRCYKDAPSFTPLLSVLRSCVKVEMAVLGSPSLISLMVSVDVKHRWTGTGESQLRSCVKGEADVLGSPSLVVLTASVDERRGGRPGLPFPRSPYGLCGRKKRRTS